MDGEPSSLMEATEPFSDPNACISYFATLRWPDGPVCPKCEGKEHYYLASRCIWKCKKCAKQFSVKVGTIFEESAIPLKKWLMALWMITNAKNSVSATNGKTKMATVGGFIGSCEMPADGG